ncbi:hypothetical protein [Bacillus sp. B1-b2]|nr:hypothetical protein [Bacillus sp. B1-b2]
MLNLILQPIKVDPFYTNMGKRKQKMIDEYRKQMMLEHINPFEDKEVTKK